MSMKNSNESNPRPIHLLDNSSCVTDGITLPTISLSMRLAVMLSVLRTRVKVRFSLFIVRRQVPLIR